jgi:hypothetical protein
VISQFNPLHPLNPLGSLNPLLQGSPSPQRLDEVLGFKGIRAYYFGATALDPPQT